MKKTLIGILLVVLLLTGCAKNNNTETDIEEPEENGTEYMSPG